MSTIKKNTLQQRKHLYKLLESFSENELIFIKNFIEYLKQTKSNGDDVFLNKLLNSDIDSKALNEKTLLEIKKAKVQVKEKKYSSLDEVMKEFGV